MFGRWGAAIVAAIVAAGGAALWIAASGGAATGALTPKGCVDDNDTGTDNCGPSTNGLARVNTLAISPDGKSVYAASEEDDAIVRFKRNARSGALTPKGCIDDNDFGTDPEQGDDNCARSVSGLHEPDALVMSRNGKSFYAASEEDDAVVRFKRDIR
jgi:sugar lactone lactonase YvrE